ncbi:MAG: glucosyltransferase domain-containing protein [Firmicutes bacterium]|nr:glucosyltransferase domain-containing protein [Bacillota bacterium]
MQPGGENRRQGGRGMRGNRKCRYITRETAITIGAVVIWYLFAHGYRFANNIYSHDALLEICQNDSAWQIALGRFVHPVLIFLRGNLCSPWLICTCAMVWICLGSCLLVQMSKLKKELQERAVTSMMTRIVAQIEGTEGYIPGVARR